MEKACREAKTHTSWTSPDTAYEDAVRTFVERCLTDGHLMQDIRQFVESLIGFGRINSLAQTLIKLTAPGVPDLYQGTELWSLHLVDPDNRRPVDYEERRRALADVKQLSAREIWDRADEGLPKMWVTHAALQLRQRQRDTFGPDSRYAAVDARGPLADHVVAFCRGENVMTLVPRLVLRANGRWHGTLICVPQGSWTNVLTGLPIEGGNVDASELWQDFPVALLERVSRRGER
jgi:(1->4)-alpha-D-glucan 1-alpha-D-glucosylmutase